jgi:hypothetical protein
MADASTSAAEEPKVCPASEFSRAPSEAGGVQITLVTSDSENFLVEKPVAFRSVSLVLVAVSGLTAFARSVLIKNMVEGWPLVPILRVLSAPLSCYTWYSTRC